MEDENSANASDILLGRPFLSTAQMKIDALELELKPLPDHLKYAFLGEGNTLPVIILSKLSRVEKENLVRILRNYKEVIGWTIFDIKGFSPSTCMHKIQVVDNAIPKREAQRRLNPPMIEAVTPLN
ncbi:hypothetical protein V6Z11_A06G097000 [Gossypium hirsutum]